MKKNKAIVTTLLFLLICTMPPTILLTNAQVNHTIEEKLVALAQEAGNKIQNLVTVVNANETIKEKIENVSLSIQFESNITLYQTEGLDKLADAKEALASSNYDFAADSALAALDIFRQVYSNLRAILETAQVQICTVTENQELIDTITSELERISTLMDILPANTSQEILNLINEANNTLLEAKTLFFEDKKQDAETRFLEAKQIISQIYQYLKTQAEESNSWRLGEYCQRLQERIQERFRYGNANGIDFAATLQGLGYQSESQFMQALQNRIQNANSQNSLQSAIQECESIGEMIQGMEQALNQEISHQQGNHGTSGNGETGGSGNENSGGNGNSSGNAYKGGNH